MSFYLQLKMVGATGFELLTFRLPTESDLKLINRVASGDRRTRLNNCTTPTLYNNFHYKSKTIFQLLIIFVYFVVLVSS